jgi:hypothetical protein
VRRCRVAFQNSADLEPGQFRQHQIKNDEIGTVIARLLQTGRAIGSRRNLEASLAQIQREKVGYVALIFDDEDFPVRGVVHEQQIQLTCGINFNRFYGC